MWQPTQPPRVNVDITSVSQSSIVSSFSSCYIGSRREGDDDDDDDDRDANYNGNDREDVGQHDQSQQTLSSFTGEVDFTHYTQEEDHGSRQVSSGIQTVGKFVQRRR